MSTKILDIVTNPDPTLRKKSKRVSDDKMNSREFRELCADMAATMAKKDGIGLAAPQIGMNIRVIIVNTKDGSVCMINPKIIKKSWRKEWGEEGCLSVPDIFGQVKRSRNVEYEYIDESSVKIKKDAEGLMARVIQHEIDHLDGILFIDKAKNIRMIAGIKQ